MDVFSEAKTKGEVIVTFLAVLELVRHDHALVDQNQLFGEIWLLPYGMFWLWVIVVCVTLLRPRPDGQWRATDAVPHNPV